MIQRQQAAKKVGRLYNPGLVMVMGKMKQFTEISNNPLSTYSDFIIVEKGDIGKIRYIEPTVE